MNHKLGNQEVLAHEALDEKIDPAHIEQANQHPAGDEGQRSDAIQAEDAEHRIPVLQALKVYKAAVLWSMAISLVIVMDGYDTGLLSSLAGFPPYREKYGQPAAKGGYQLTPIWQTALVEAPIVGNILGIFISSWFQDRYGYRRTIQVFLVFLTGVIFIVFYAPTVEVLFVGLLLCGLPWGAFSSSAVSYASEVMPIPLRGYLTTLTKGSYVNLCWIMGQLIASGVLVGVSDRSDEWAYRIPFAVQWVWPVPLFILATFAPESPWFLVRNSRLSEAEKAVSRLAKEGESSHPAQIVAMMVRTNQVEQSNRPGTSYLDCLKGADLRRTEIACLAWAGQILAGSTFANNPTYFLQQAGFDTKNSFNVGLGAKGLAFIGTCGSWIALSYWGRRPVFISGLAILATCLILVGGISFAGDSNARWGSAALVLVWVFVYDFTVGPLAYAIVGESSSTRLRSKTVGLARNSYNVVRIVAGLLYTYQVNPTAWAWGGKAGFFWGGSATLICIWAYFRLPEFKGRSFRELDILFARRVPASKFKTTVIAEVDER